MPGFSIGGAVNSAADWVSNSPVVGKVVGNPFFAALLITAMIAVVLIAMFRRQLAGVETTKKARAFLWIFLLVTGVIFVHQYSTVRNARETADTRAARDVFTSIANTRVGGAFSRTGEARGYAPLSVAPVTGGADCGCDERPDNVRQDDFVLDEVVLPSSATVLGTPVVSRTVKPFAAKMPPVAKNARAR